MRFLFWEEQRVFLFGLKYMSLTSVFGSRECEKQPYFSGGGRVGKCRSYKRKIHLLLKATGYETQVGLWWRPKR